MSERHTATFLISGRNVALIGLVTLFGLVAIHFASLQSVWTDEATQLSGLSLGFIDQLWWLTGRLPHAFNVPLDRTPPVSYWLGGLWIRVFGGGIPALRGLSVFLSVASIVAVYVIARRFFEGRSALIGAALLALSPNFLVEAVEIRAYAAFIFSSALLIYCYLRVIAAKPNPSSCDLWAFSLAATLCSYTHFFGIVISTGAAVCLLAVYYLPRSHAAELSVARRAILPMLCYLVTIAALVPFVFAAVTISGGGADGDSLAVIPSGARIHDLARLIYRLFCHQSMLGIPGLSALALLAGASLSIFAVSPGSNQHSKQLLLFLVVNLILTSLVGLATRSFNAFTPSYSSWSLPVISLISASALSHANRCVRVASIACIAVMAAANVYGTTRLALAGEIYGHTRSTVIKTAVDEAGPGNVILLYINDAPSLYFALNYYYGNALRQYVAGERTIRLVGSPNGSPSLKLCELNAPTLLIAHDQQLSAERLQFLATHAMVRTEASQAIDEFLNNHEAELAAYLKLSSRNEYLAQSALALATLKNRAPSGTICGAD